MLQKHDIKKFVKVSDIPLLEWYTLAFRKTYSQVQCEWVLTIFCYRYFAGTTASGGKVTYSLLKVVSEMGIFV